MAVAKHGGLPRSVQPVRVNQGMPGSGNDFDMFQTRLGQRIRHKLRAPGDVRLMLGQSRDTGDAEKVLQFAQQAIAVLEDEGIRSLGHSF